MGERAGFGVILPTSSPTGCSPALCPPCPLNLQGGGTPWGGKGCGAVRRKGHWVDPGGIGAKGLRPPKLLVGQENLQGGLKVKPSLPLWPR